MRTYEKVEIALRIVLDMLTSERGVSLHDIRFSYSDKPLGRGTAERYRNAIKRVFPQFEEVNPHHYPRRWRLSKKPLKGLKKMSGSDVTSLANAVVTLRSAKLYQPAPGKETTLHSLIKKSTKRRP